MDYYKIGEVCVEWTAEYDIHLAWDEFIKLFVIDATEAGNLERIRFQGVSMNMGKFENMSCLRRTGGYELFQTPRGKFLINHWGTCRFAYGLWLDDLKSSDTILISFHPNMKEQILLNRTRFFSTVGLHSKFLQKNAPVLHSSYIDYQGQAILFTAPSQVGKSTQAELWKKYEGAEIINGDRTLLRRREDGWYAFGYPCCGSSSICINRTLPLRAIVVLEQGKENKIEKLTLGQKIRALVSGIEVYPWDIHEVEKSFFLAQKILQEVPVIALRCRPDADAVSALKQYLSQ